MTLPATDAHGFDAVADRLDLIQGAVAHMRACVNAGDAASIYAAATSLTDLLRGAEDDFVVVRKAVEALGAASVPEAAHLLRVEGHGEDAQVMMRLDATAHAISDMRITTAGFIRECLDSLDTAREQVSQGGSRGRLLGSA